MKGSQCVASRGKIKAFTVLNRKMYMICHQRLRKHAKLKHWLLQQQCYSQFILLFEFPFPEWNICLCFGLCDSALFLQYHFDTLGC